MAANEMSYSVEYQNYLDQLEKIQRFHLLLGLNNFTRRIQKRKRLLKSIKENTVLTESEKATLTEKIQQANKKDRSKTLKICIVLLLFTLFCFAMSECDSGGSKRKNDSNDYKNGFIGSDGEFHAYIPEFGDDVNNWMEENW